MLTKKEIIQVLQKYAKQNGGKTPSEKIFYENTEVGVWDRMKYWPNYGALVSEAGLVPNQFDKTKYSPADLCKLFIEIIREKDRWPTRGDLDVKHYDDSKFPHSTTFYNKLGLTKNLAKTILEFVENKRGYSDIVEICGRILKKFDNGDESPEAGSVTSGFVYLGRQHGIYKLGRSKDPKRRREDITLLGSEPFETIHEIEMDDMVSIEAYWHNRFKPKRKRGEWFNLSSSDVNAFKHWRKII